MKAPHGVWRVCCRVPGRIGSFGFSEVEFVVPGGQIWLRKEPVVVLRAVSRSIFTGSGGGLSAKNLSPVPGSKIIVSPPSSGV